MLYQRAEVTSMDQQQEATIREKISGFEYENPLGVSWFMAWLVRIYAPILALFTPLSALFAIWVLKSRFLRRLTCEPILSQLLALTTMLALAGPAYIWVLQEWPVYLSAEHVGRNIHPCNLLLWIHNFSLMATSWTIALLLVERTMSINSKEESWPHLQMASSKVSTGLLVFLLPVSILGVICSDVSGSNTPLAYPVCNPWWQNEYTSAGPVWYKSVAILFSVAPSLVIVLTTLLLLLSVARYRLLVRWSVDALDHYNGLFLELRARSHLKFVNSAVWLGAVFLVTVVPLGVFILVGPALHSRLYHNNSLTYNHAFQIQSTIDT
ncbi:uncharacterized protein LOC101861080, partial [Aplysia californica]|uniref:Uncharacterized protein LOC101861080 n=1 Tax=Aplysia californica TaxID=6500 RepID=A0ABM1AB87_APLCA